MIDGSVDFRKSPADILDIEICCRISTLFIIDISGFYYTLWARGCQVGISILGLSRIHAASMVGSNVMHLWDFLLKCDVAFQEATGESQRIPFYRA